MAFNNFIPTLWSGTLLRQLENTHVFAQPGVCNRNYEGEIKQMGDTVKITSIGPVTIGDYTKNSNMSAAEAITDAGQTLQITQQKYFNFQVDDIDQAQAAGGTMEAAMQEAAYGLGEVADEYIAGLYSQVATANFYGTDASPKTISSATDVYNYLTRLKTILDENNVPRDGRWVVVPPFLEEYMLQDERFVKSFNANSEQRLLNGLVARAAGFDILQSNNVSHNGSGEIPVTNDECRVLAGHPIAITFAEQINQVEAYRPELRFADAAKGLHLYGAKVIRPSALAVLTITRPA
jgi:hypothetical protein